MTWKAILDDYLTINTYQCIGSASQANFLRVFQGVKSLPGLNSVHQRRAVTVLLRIDQINARLIQRYGIRGGQDADVVEVRLSGISVAVTVDGDTIHHIDIDDLFPTT